ncbi:hypothetical protein EDB85DRAFT_1899271 [Lactarius pseudohatsudake]|nr:hypothetical protein EDB85DRAFT_1899271 [Lactarius pseudohatsudake]
MVRTACCVIILQQFWVERKKDKKLNWLMSQSMWARFLHTVQPSVIRMQQQWAWQWSLKGFAKKKKQMWESVEKMADLCMRHGPQYHGYARWRTWPGMSWASAQMHKICHCRCLEHMSHLHLSPPQHAAPTWLMTPRHHHPNTARNTPTTNPPPRHPQYGTQHPTTAMLPQHNAQHPTDPPHCLNAAREAQPPPTPTPRHGAHDRATHQLATTTTQHGAPRPRHIAQDPTDLPCLLNRARKAATTNPHNTACTTVPPADSPPLRPNTAHQDPTTSHKTPLTHHTASTGHARQPPPTPTTRHARPHDPTQRMKTLPRRPNAACDHNHKDDAWPGAVLTIYIF